MKRLFTVVMCTFLLAGCSTKQKVIKNADENMYRSFYEDLYEQTSFQSESEYFHTSLELAETDGSDYAYAVILDQPDVAMYSIKALVLEDDTPYADNNKMMPSSGIIDTAYSMIPNQVNRSSGYVKGIALRGTTDKSSLEIRLLVEWTTENNETRREYLRWQLSEEGAMPIDD